MSEKTEPSVTKEEAKSAPLQKSPDLEALRKSRGLTLENIFIMTRVSITILKAIENGEFHLLPAPVYTKRFIQAYANAIGIDAGSILAHYQRYVDAIKAVPEDVEVANAQISFDRKPFKGRYLLYAAAIVAIFATAFTIYALFHEKEISGNIQHIVTGTEQKETAPKPATAVKEQSMEAVADAPRTPPPVMGVHEEATQAPSTADINLLIEATENTWLKITEDRNPSYQITLKTGDKLSRKAREFFIVDVGNAAGVNITFNGKSLGNLGRKGQVVHLRLPQQ
ncbi:MAG: helix-turn-helix domain-containing protein [Desulfuromonadaceae bacterium]